MKEYIELKIKEIETKINPGYYLQSVSDNDLDLNDVGMMNKIVKT